MSESPVGDKPGLRERKKAKTRAAIQDHALRLFREQGYDATTVEQIAEAAEVSPSTFFRYFPTKEDVVIYDAIDPLIFEAARALPRELGPIQAIRRAMLEVMGNLSPDEREIMSERGRLVFGVPELRLAMIDDLFRTGDLMVAEIAARLDRSPEDFEIRVFAGAIVGGLLAAMVPLVSDPEADVADFAALIDRAFEFLDKGMPL